MKRLVLIFFKIKVFYIFIFLVYTLLLSFDFSIVFYIGEVILEYFSKIYIIAINRLVDLFTYNIFERSII